jgi:RHS repeat-associated protein
VLKYRVEDGAVAEARLFLRDEQGNVLTEMAWVETDAAGYWARAKDHVYLGRDLIGTLDRATGEPQVVSYARDHLGSQRAEVWALDASTATDLWPYGALARTKAAGTAPSLADGAHLFTGHEREHMDTAPAPDPLQGLDYMHARYYSFPTGRFLSVDPIETGRSRYSYVDSNPLSFRDLDGQLKIRAVRTNIKEIPGYQDGFAYSIVFESAWDYCGPKLVKWLWESAKWPSIVQRLDDQTNWYTNDTSDIRFLSTLWKKAKFEKQIKRAFEKLAHETGGAPGLYESGEVDRLKEIVARVLRELERQGEITHESAIRIARAYDPEILKRRAREKAGYFDARAALDAWEALHLRSISLAYQQRHAMFR